MKPLVILPTYNEAENIVEVLDRVREAVPEADVLVVDDGSPDGTAALAEEWGSRHGGGLALLRRLGEAGARVGLPGRVRPGSGPGVRRV